MNIKTLNIIFRIQLILYVLLPVFAGSELFAQNNLPDNVNSANCVIPPMATEWGIEVGWSSASIVSNLNSPLVGDLDNDGHPEVICFSKECESSNSPHTDNQILVFDGVTKQLKTTITMSSPVTAYDADAYGLVKLPSGKGLIVTACYDYKLRAYDITASDPNDPYWTSDVDYGSNYGDFSVNVSFADFNQDGHPEVYVRNKIYSAETGALLVSTTSSDNTASSYCHWTHSTHYKLSSPMAADVCDDSKLELILGNEIYAVNITNPYGSAGNTITLARQVTPPGGAPIDGNVQVADFNADGYLDVFISIRNTAENTGTVYCYVWDVHNNAVSNSLIINNSHSGKSIPMIADIDNDGLMEVLIQSGVANTEEKFQAYKYQPGNQTFSFLWGFATDEDSYSNTITSFDFNQDGLLELLICDQSTVRIVNGSGYSHVTGNDTIPVYVMSSFPFSETTIMQYPVIVDVDDDGNAEIVSVGSLKLNIFESSGSPWAPTRKVWNQYMYNVTNVNQDLTIPQYLFNNATPFVDPQGVTRCPFNNFLQQATTIDQYGRPFYAVPDVVSLSAEVTYDSSEASLNVTYTNQGDNILNAPYSITVFANQLGGQVLQTVTINTPLPVGGTNQQNIPLSLSALCQMQDVSNLVVAVNCAGAGIAQEGGLQHECDISNNTATDDISISFTSSFDATACDSYTWNGIPYNASGTYVQDFVSQQGCDSVVTLNLTVNHSALTNLTVETCEPYVWYGTTYSNSGVYEHLLQTAAGCDSLLVLDLTIGTAFNSEESVNACDSYRWRSTTYFESGTYTETVPGTGGCDSTFVLNLTINPSATTNLIVETCEPYAWYGTTYSHSGIYEHLLQTTAGCDSLLVLDLTIGSVYNSVENVEACERYVWRGTTYRNSGTYTETVPGVGGCDSTFVLHLTINHGVTTNLAVETCDPYAWYGTIYNHSGVYEHMLQTAAGCDSLLVLDLTVGTAFSSEENASACESYEWRGNVYDESGTYTEIIPGIGGCDSTFILHLTINYGVTTNLTVETCEPYAWYGTTYSNSGVYEYLSQTAAGCDSLLVLDLTIGTAFNSEENISVCDSYVWRGTTYVESGIYTETVQDPIGCDSTFVLNLTVYYSDTLDWEPVYACDAYEWHGSTYTQSGMLTYQTTNENGCSRLERLQLTINHSAENEFYVTGCESYEWYGVLYEEPGVYQHTLTSVHGCDSLLIMHLDIGETFVLEENVLSCGEYEWRGTIYTESGSYQQEVPNSMGCDSLFVLHLVVSEAAHYEFDHQSCGIYTWNGVDYDTSGDYQQLFSTSDGCDSVVVMHFNILDSYLIEIDTVSCGLLLWQGELLSESGDYSTMLQSAMGCDSLVILHLLKGEEMDNAITGLVSVYFATNMVYGTYTYHLDSTGINPSSVHWSIDRDDWQIHPQGATCTLVCTSEGVGKLRAWTENEICNVDTSLVIHASYFDIEENNSVISIYPNPTKGILTVEAEGIEGIRLIDMVGQVLETHECGSLDAVTLNLKGYKPSVYLLEVKTVKGVIKQRVVLCR